MHMLQFYITKTCFLPLSFFLAAFLNLTEQPQELALHLLLVLVEVVGFL